MKMSVTQKYNILGICMWHCVVSLYWFGFTLNYMKRIIFKFPHNPVNSVTDYMVSPLKN